MVMFIVVVLTKAPPHGRAENMWSAKADGKVSQATKKVHAQ